MSPDAPVTATRRREDRGGEGGRCPGSACGDECGGGASGCSECCCEEGCMAPILPLRRPAVAQ
ncbi:hypothetical protein GCM10017752_50180 [Streptomyces roseoviridis]